MKLLPAALFAPTARLAVTFLKGAGCRSLRVRGGADPDCLRARDQRLLDFFNDNSYVSTLRSINMPTSQSPLAEQDSKADDSIEATPAPRLLPKDLSTSLTLAIASVVAAGFAGAGISSKAEAAVVFPNLDNSFVFINETGTSRASRSYSSTPITITQELKDASEFRFNAAISTGTASVAGTAVQGANVLTYTTEINLFEGPQATADGDAPVFSTSVFPLATVARDEFGNSLNTVTTPEGYVVFAKPANQTDLGAPRPEANALTDYIYLTVDLSAADNIALSNYFSQQAVGTIRSLNITDLRGVGSLLVATQDDLGDNAAVSLSSGGFVFEDLGTSISLSPIIPEPSTAAILLAGVGLIASKRR